MLSCVLLYVGPDQSVLQALVRLHCWRMPELCDSTHTDDESPCYHKGCGASMALLDRHRLCRSPHKRWRMVVLDGYDISMLGWPESHPNHAAALEILESNNPNQVTSPLCLPIAVTCSPTMPQPAVTLPGAAASLRQLAASP